MIKKMFFVLVAILAVTTIKAKCFNTFEFDRVLDRKEYMKFLESLNSFDCPHGYLYMSYVFDTEIIVYKIGGIQMSYRLVENRFPLVESDDSMDGPDHFMDIKGKWNGHESVVTLHSIFSESKVVDRDFSSSSQFFSAVHYHEFLRGIKIVSEESSEYSILIESSFVNSDIYSDIISYDKSIKVLVSRVEFEKYASGFFQNEPYYYENYNGFEKKYTPASSNIVTKKEFSIFIEKRDFLFSDRLPVFIADRIDEQLQRN